MRCQSARSPLRNRQEHGPILNVRPLVHPGRQSLLNFEGPKLPTFLQETTSGGLETPLEQTG